MNPVVLAASVHFVLHRIFAVGVCAIPGTLGDVLANRFAGIATRGSQWIDTDKLLEFLDKPIHVDRQVLRYSRVFGVLVMLRPRPLARVSLLVSHFVVR